VVEALARVAAPRAAAAGLAGELAAAVAARLEAAPAARLQARVAPEVAASVAERLGEGLDLATDAALGPTEARLDWPGGGLRFDADAAASAALEAITRHFGAAADPREAAADPASPAPPDGDRTEDLKDVG
jgi:hypothetical protein